VQIVTAADRPDLDEQAGAAFREKWPEFIFHDAVAPVYMPRVEEYFARYNIFVLDDGAVVAGGWGVPFAWDGAVEHLPDGYDAALARAVEGREAGTPASVVLEELTRRAVEDGLVHVVAPLRPTWKHRYPLVPMAEYAGWVRDDGLSVDPWIRTHQRMGAEVLGPAPRSMVIEGNVAEWETWADMAFPVSGDYVVPDALNLVHVDREQDRAVYVEENLWVRHR
jgi:hypothetical protein